MLIANNHVLKGLDPNITPAIKHGSLYPPEDYGNPELASMAPKSLYLSCIYPTVGCELGDAVISLWIKAKKTQDGCGTLGSCSDWQEISVGGISRGTTPPIGTEQEFCCKPVGAWYIQICSGGDTCSTSGEQPYLWLKTLEGCTANDWTLISPSVSPIYFGDLDPNEDDGNCSLPVGSIYYQYCPGQSTTACVIVTNQTTKPNLIRWEKVQSCCEGSDWVNTNATPVVKLDTGIEFDCTHSAIECLPVGAIVYNEDCELWIRLGCENADNCGDWCFINNHPPLTLTPDGPQNDLDEENQVLTVHPPMSVAFQGTEFSFDPDTQDMTIPNPCELINFEISDERLCDVTFPTLVPDTDPDTNVCTWTLNLPPDIWATSRTLPTMVALVDNAWTDISLAGAQFENAPDGETFFTGNDLCLTVPDCMPTQRYTLSGLANITIDPAQADLNTAVGGVALLLNGVQEYKRVTHFDDAGEIFDTLAIPLFLNGGDQVCLQAFVRNTNGTANATIGDIHLEEQRTFN